MLDECYYYRLPDDRIVSIRRSDHNVQKWNLCLGITLIEGNYSAAEEAASHAFMKDFCDPDATRIFRRVHVPDDLNRWASTSLKNLQDLVDVQRRPKKYDTPIGGEECSRKHSQRGSAFGGRFGNN